MAEFARLSPAEVLLAEDQVYPSALEEATGSRTLPAWEFDLDQARTLLTQQFGVRDLAGFGCEDKTLAVTAAGALLSYVKETQRSELLSPNREICSRSAFTIISIRFRLYYHCLRL